MKNVAFAFVMTALTACAGSAGEDTAAKAGTAASANGYACTAASNQADQYTLTLEAKGDKLSVLQSSTTARYAPIEYEIHRINLIAAPVETPKFACQDGNRIIRVWNKYAQVGSAYYELKLLSGNPNANDGGNGGGNSGNSGNAGSSGSAGLSCQYVIDAQNQHQVSLAVTGNLLAIRESSANARYAPVDYKLNRVMLNVAPAGVPKYACPQGGPVIMVWEKYARVGGAYYALASAN